MRESEGFILLAGHGGCGDVHPGEGGRECGCAGARREGSGRARRLLHARRGRGERRARGVALAGFLSPTARFAYLEERAPAGKRGGVHGVWGVLRRRGFESGVRKRRGGGFRSLSLLLTLPFSRRAHVAHGPSLRLAHARTQWW